MESTQGTLSRRRLLWLAGLGMGALVLDGCGLGRPAGSMSSSSQPAEVTGTPRPHVTQTGQIRDYSLEAGPLDMELDGRKLSTWGYNGGLLGPEIRLKEGDTLRATVSNRLPEATTIHWHGLPIPNRMDGVPDVTQPAIKPGEHFTYEFVAPVSGTFMYHSHAGLQLDRGLFGPLIIEPNSEPLSYDREFTLMLDDWLDGLPGTPDDAMQQLVAGGDRMMSGMSGMTGMGQMGDGLSASPAESPPDLVYPLYLINGKPASAPLEVTVKPGDMVRLRLINPSAATIYRVALAGHRLMVTHADGQPVEPVEVDVIRIGMGERYDVLVKATNPGIWQLAAQAEGAPHLARAIVRYDGSTGALPPAEFQPPELRRTLLLYSMLKTNSNVGSLSNSQPDQRISITLNGGMGHYVWTINDQIYAKASPIAVRSGDHVRFEFQNMSMMPHPMHLHGHFFQVDTGTGRGPLKDTVIVEPMQKLAIDWISDNPGDWAFHCHNLYHQETGMMRVVKVG